MTPRISVDLAALVDRVLAEVGPRAAVSLSRPEAFERLLEAGVPLEGMDTIRAQLEERLGAETCGRLAASLDASRLAPLHAQQRDWILTRAGL